MKFKKILCLNYDESKLDQSHWDELKAFTDTIVTASEQELMQHADIDCLLVKLGAKVDKTLINQLPNLKYIGMLGTGIGGIDKEYAESKNVTVTKITDYATEGVSEFTFGALISHLREFERARKQALDENYSESTFTGSEIAGKTFGIIGLGNIGTRTAELAKAFGANVIYWSKNSKDAQFQYSDLNKLLTSSDIISINISLTPETTNLLDVQRIKSIKNGAVIINTCPMELLDFDTLARRLANNEITFILDHSDEMTKENINKVKHLANCIIYPPIGYTTKEATAKKQDVFINNIKSFLAE